MKQAIAVFVLCLFSLAPDFAYSFQYPSDWTRSLVPMQDSRKTLPPGSPRNALIEIASIPYQGNEPKVGAVLMVPGVFQNGNSFDLLPEDGISFARSISKQFNLQVYLLHTRGLGQSSLGKKLNLDDFAIDDLPAAIDWVSEKEHSKILVFGNSQGGIMLQATLAGLSRCQSGNCFDSIQASIRQSRVFGLAISGGSASLTHEKNHFFFPALLNLYRLIRHPVTHTFDYVNIYTLMQEPALAPIAQFPFWKFLYLEENVSKEARLALVDRTVEASWAGVLLQFGHGIAKGGIRTSGQSSEQKSYVSGFKNIQIPTVQVTYEMDPFAEPEVTERDSFAYIGSPEKRFFSFPNQSHEDYLMSAELHHDWDQPIRWLLFSRNPRR